MQKLAKQWAGELVGTVVEGAVRDAKTGDTRGYRLLCTRVSYSGFGDRISIVWDDKHNGGYQRVERTAKDLKGETARSQADALEATVQARLASELEASQYGALEGEL